MRQAENSAIDQAVAGNGDAWRQAVVVAAVFQLAITLMVGWLLVTNRATSLAAGYFFDHDAYLLTAGGLVLLGMGWWPLRGAPVPALDRRSLFLWSVVVALAAYAGTFLVFHHYAVSRDEQSAEFAATYFAAGRLGWPIPPHLRDLAQAMMPMHTVVRPETWLSSYLPVNAAIRAGVSLLGDQWLAGPLLLLVGIVALASAARQIWPGRPHATIVAVVLALTSTQVIVNAATPFAMTGQFALTAMWLACFLRGGVRGHALAITAGLFASGLHQSHFHIGFVMAFIAWLVMDRRFRLAGCYALACLFYWFMWHHAWAWLLDTMEGLPRPLTGGLLPPGTNPILWRLSQLQIGESLTRFIAWQNILLLPLAIAGVGAVRQATGPARILIGCALACGWGLALLVSQDHGYGYRYLHHLIPCFCLLAAGGWLAIEERLGRRLPASILVVAAAFAAVFTLPVATWRIMVANAPYERAYAAANTAKADYLFVDTRAGAYLQDIVRVEKGPRPVLLDLGYVPAAAVARLCAGSRVMIFGEAQARHFGIPIDPDRVTNAEEAAARAAQIKRLGCGRPMPLG